MSKFDEQIKQAEREYKENLASLEREYDIVRQECERTGDTAQMFIAGRRFKEGKAALWQKLKAEREAYRERDQQRRTELARREHQLYFDYWYLPDEYDGTFGFGGKV